jgi:SAM-dependent methyltransferase
MNAESSVLQRYSAGAKAVEPSLCCPVSYDPSFLALLPREIVERDYGCGDPSRYLRAGDTVLDLCYIAAQIVGESGRVIGVDMNDDMLALARRHQPEMARKLGGDRVRFVKAHIQDLALDLDAQDAWLAAHPVRTSRDLAALQAWQAAQRREQPLIADCSVGVVVSNCVLNLVAGQDRQQMVREIFRVLKPGGRVAISDIVSDEPVPAHLRADPELWSGCISGAFQEQAFLRAFLDAGFIAVRYDKWDAAPWRVVEGIEFRSATLTAVKGEGAPCLDYGHAVVYRGPFSEVRDDENHIYPRGERMAVCERTYRLLTEGPYRDDFIGIPPAVAREPVSFCAPPGTRRAAAESKGAVHVGRCDAPNCC